MKLKHRMLVQKEYGCSETEINYGKVEVILFVVKHSSEISMPIVC